MSLLSTGRVLAGRPDHVFSFVAAVSLAIEEVVGLRTERYCGMLRTSGRPVSVAQRLSTDLRRVGIGERGILLRAAALRRPGVS